MHVHIIATGGTIATGASGLPEHGAASILAAVPKPPGVELTAEDVGPLPGPSWDRAFLETVYARVTHAMAEADAVVVTQGTDTLEETSYLFDRWQDWPKPLVFTGAMRNPSLISPDGPGNLDLALRAAATPELFGSGVLVALADEVHLATYVEKGWSQRLSAFSSPLTGPFAIHGEGTLYPLYRPIPHPHYPAPALTAKVALVRTALAMEPDMLPGGRFDAVVLEGMGGGHVPASILPAIDAWLEGGTPVVVVPRPTRGPVLRGTYAFPGSERDLARRGVVLGQGPGLKARLRLWLALSLPSGERPDIAAVAQAF
jgi:L-asparaginase